MADVNPNLKKTELSIRRRVECEKRAFHIVNELIEGFVSEQHLSECGQFLSKENYDDVVEERAIGLLCGYPVCEDKLPHTPKKKYHISTKTNTVYDISERKSFCSNQCFKASKCFRHQIPETPVWSREEEDIDIVVSPHKSQPGLVGDKVVGNPTRTLEQEVEKLNEMDMKYTEKNVKPERNVKRNESEDCSNSQDAKKTNKAVSNPIHKSDTQPTSVDVEEVQSDLDRLKLDDSPTMLSGAGPEGKPTTVDLSRVQDENHEHISNSKSTIENESAGKQIPSKPLSNLEKLQKLMNQKKNVLSKMVDSQEVVKAPTHPEDKQTNVGPSNKDLNHPEDENSKKQRQKPRKCRPEKRPQSPPSPLRALCQILKSWMSVSTVDFLNFKQTHPHPSDPHPINPTATTLSSLEVQVGGTSLSANLRSQEKRLNSILGEDDGGDDGKEERKAVPDYTALREESEQFQLKVTEYITGKRPKDQHKKAKDDPEEAVYIPTVDAYDQGQIRTKLVLEKLDKCLPSVLDPMGLALQDVAAPIRQLVYTFRLERDTITFKPAQWTLVGLLLLKMLSLKVPSIAECFQTESTHHFLSVLLKAINHQVEDLDLCTTEMLAVAAVEFVE